MAVLEAYKAYTRPLPGGGRREAPRPSLQYQARQRERMRELGLLPEAPPSPLEVAREQEERAARERQAAEEEQIRAEERATLAGQAEREEERDWQREVAWRKEQAAQKLAETKASGGAAVRRGISGVPEPPRLPSGPSAARVPPRVRDTLPSPVLRPTINGRPSEDVVRGPGIYGPEGEPFTPETGLTAEQEAELRAGTRQAFEGPGVGVEEFERERGLAPSAHPVYAGEPPAELEVPELPPATVWEQRQAEIDQAWNAGAFGTDWPKYQAMKQKVNDAERESIEAQEETRTEQELTGKRASLWFDLPGVGGEEALLRGAEGLPPLAKPQAPPADIKAAVRAYRALGYNKEQAEALAAAERPVPTRPLPTKAPFERKAWEAEELSRRRGAGLRRGLGRKPALPPPQLPGQAPSTELIPEDLKYNYPRYTPAQRGNLVKALRDQGQAELAAALEAWMPAE